MRRVWIRALARWVAHLGVALALPAISTVAVAQADATTGVAVDATARPRIALVLSGGGARGFAHVGVLRELQELRVPIDVVAGVSMGAVVGGAYASGRTVDELEQFVRATDWTGIVADRPPRDDLSFRRREDDLLLPSRLEFGVGSGGVRLPPSTAGNAVLEAALAKLLPPGAATQPVDRLALPFRTVASDLLTGELVELYDTPLFMSLRASLSVPGVFAPVRVNQRLLVDGGLVRNLPVDVARAMGADVVIAVNVGTPLAGEDELGSALGVARQMLNILTAQNVQRSLKELGERDVLITPDLTGISFLDFRHGEQAMAAGRAAVRQLAPRLQALASSPEAYAAAEQQRMGASRTADVALPLRRLTVPATEHIGSAALAEQSGLRVGEPVTLAQVDRAAARLFGQGEFERVEAEVHDEAGARDVRLAPVEAAWARSRLRLGLQFISDFSDDNRFTVNAMHTLSGLNSWGAELRTIARIGSERTLTTQWWQPLAPGSDWVALPSLQYQASALDVYDQGRRTLRVGYEVSTATLAIGRMLSQWGQVQLGVDRRSGSSRSLINPGEAGSSSALHETATFVQVQLDTLDSLALPSSGGLLVSRVERSSSSTGEGHATASVVGLAAFRVGAWDSHVYGEWSRSREGLAPVSLGGFLRLSGTPRDSLAGGDVVFGRLVMARRIGDMPAGLGGAVRAGFSLELGGGYEAQDSLRWSDLRQAGSGFVAVDTRFGPVFLALGATRGVGGTLYIFLGPFW